MIIGIVEPIYNMVSTWDEPVCIAVLPDHPTPVEVRTHVKEPVPFIIWYHGIEADNVDCYDEVACVSGSYGMLHLEEFMDTLMNRLNMKYYSTNRQAQRPLCRKAV